MIDPATSSWRDEFAAAYATMRAAKGVTVDAARDRLADPNYFGTMMVHRGYAAAVVPGAAHPTADSWPISHFLGNHRGRVRYRTADSHAVLLHRHVRPRHRCREGRRREGAAQPARRPRNNVDLFDLNTGNNTYKAVQRSAGAVAVRPVLQGLRKPVNDLSRGATVADIVNTVATTVIQAAATS